MVRCCFVLVESCFHNERIPLSWNVFRVSTFDVAWKRHSYDTQWTIFSTRNAMEFSKIRCGVGWVRRNAQNDGKKHTQNNLNLCIFPISASKIFIMLKSQLKNIERGTCFIVVVNSMHQCYWFYRWIVWRVRCQMWSVWNVSVSPKSSNVLFFFFTLCSFSWTSWNSTSKSAELEMCYGKTQNQNTIKTKRINSKLVKNWLKSYRKTLIEWEIVEIVVKCKCVNVFWLCWKNKWCTISRIIEMD